MLKAVMFDYGGTLVTSIGDDIMPLVSEGAKLAHTYLQTTIENTPPFPAFFTAAAQAIQAAYVRFAATANEMDAVEVIRDVLKNLGLPVSDEQFRKFAREWQKPFTAKTNLNEGAKECLDALKKTGLKLAVISNNIWPQSFLEEELTRLGVMEYFDYIVTSSRHGMKKPHAPIFEDALAALGVAAEETAFVGDSIKEDVAGASMLGIKTVLLDWKREEMPGVEPDAKIKSLSELPGVLMNPGEQ